MKNNFNLFLAFNKNIVLTVILLLNPIFVFADPIQPAVDPCGKIGGCDPNIDQLINLLVQNTAAIFVALAAGAAVLFVIVGGFQMLLSFGNDSMISKGKNSVIYALIGFALTLSSQAIVSFVINRAISGGLADSAENPALVLMRISVDGMLSVFNAIFVVVAVFAGLRMVFGHGKSDEFTKARTILIYAVVGAILVNVARALVSIILTAGF